MSKKLYFFINSSFKEHGELVARKLSIGYRAELSRYKARFVSNDVIKELLI